MGLSRRCYSYRGQNCYLLLSSMVLIWKLLKVPVNRMSKFMHNLLKVLFPCITAHMVVYFDPHCFFLKVSQVLSMELCFSGITNFLIWIGILLQIFTTVTVDEVAPGLKSVFSFTIPDPNSGKV